MSYLKPFIFFCFIIFSNLVYSQDPPKDKFERRALQMVESLKETKSATAYFKKSDSPLRAYNDGRDGEGYYIIREAQFRGGITFTQYLFLVNPRRNIIKYWDIPADTVISLASWRRNNYKIDRISSKKAKIQ